MGVDACIYLSLKNSRNKWASYILTHNKYHAKENKGKLKEREKVIVRKEIERKIGKEGILESYRQRKT